MAGGDCKSILTSLVLRLSIALIVFSLVNDFTISLADPAEWSWLVQENQQVRNDKRIRHAIVGLKDKL